MTYIYDVESTCTTLHSTIVHDILQQGDKTFLEEGGDQGEELAVTNQPLENSVEQLSCHAV